MRRSANVAAIFLALISIATIATIASATATATAMATPANSATPRTTLSAVEAGVMCPTCGIPLAEANSPQSDRERVYILGLIAAGDSLAQIKAALVSQYGPGVLALPKDSGFNVAAYLVPIILAALIMLSLLIALPRWRKRSTQSEDPDPAPLSPQDAQRLDGELELYG